MSSLREYEEWAREAREIRRRRADWEFIESQPEPVKTALKLLVETGDLKLAALIAGMKLGDFNDLRIKARIPMVI